MSQRAVSDVKRKIGPQYNSTGEIKFHRKPTVSTSSVIAKVIRKIDVDDPPPQLEITKSCRLRSHRIVTFQSMEKAKSPKTNISEHLQIIVI